MKKKHLFRKSHLFNEINLSIGFTTSRLHYTLLLFTVPTINVVDEIKNLKIIILSHAHDISTILLAMLYRRDVNGYKSIAFSDGVPRQRPYGCSPLNCSHYSSYPKTNSFQKFCFWPCSTIP